MDYEKAYKDALTRARLINNWKRIEVENGTSICEAIFPELAESEDEKIRKELIQLISCMSNSDSRKERWIAWVEKQSKPEDKGEISDGYHTFNELYYYRLLYNAAFFNLLPKDIVHKSKKHHDGDECFGGGWFIVIADLPTGQISNHYELKYWNLFQIQEKEIADKWDGHTPQEAAERLYKYLLEKQGEQEEPQVYEIKDGEIITYSENEGYKVVEPKFKVGEWIAREELNTARIINIVDDRYEVEFIDGDKDFPRIDYVDRIFHLWTIQDAKDGDVLVNGSNIFIFHSINDARLMGYCHVNTDDGRFYDDLGKNEWFCLIDAVVKPATKEQRNLLFSKMKEARYMWDDEKLILKCNTYITKVETGYDKI